MQIVRALVIVLAVLNLLLFAAGRGWLGRSGSGEPERLAQQIAPERIRIVEGGKPDPIPVAAPPAAGAPKAASTKKAAPNSEERPAPEGEAKLPAQGQPGSDATASRERDDEVCQRYAPLSRDQAARIAELAGAHDPQVQVSRKPLKPPTSYWAYIPASDNPLDVDAQVAALKSADIKDWYVMSSGSDKGTISLGVFGSLEKANTRKEQLLANGITGVLAGGRESPGAKGAVELTGTAVALDALAQQIVTAEPGVVARACVH